jgi:hypothetical protein
MWRGFGVGALFSTVLFSEQSSKSLDGTVGMQKERRPQSCGTRGGREPKRLLAEFEPVW